MVVVSMADLEGLGSDCALGLEAVKVAQWVKTLVLSLTT